ncbi:hypothetical protein [Alsobacter sp. R-9]
MLAAGLYAASSRTGVSFTEDVWAYWQGAISILDGQGYRYFSGNPITAWPPLYSAYLAIWSGVLGRSALSLAFAHGALIAVQAAGWCLLYRSLRPEARADRGWISGAIAVWLASYVALNQIYLLSHTIQLAILPYFLTALVSLVGSERPGWTAGGLALSGALLSLAHNSSVAHVGAAALCILALARGPLTMRVAVSCGLVLAAGGTSLLTRVALGQGQTPPFVGGRFGPLETVSQALGSIGGSLLAGRPGKVVALVLLAYAMAVVARVTRLEDRAASLHCLAATAAIFLLFNVLWLNGSIAETRHLLFVAAVLVPLAVVHLTEIRPVYGGLAAIALVLAAVAWQANTDVSSLGERIPLSAELDASLPPRAQVIRNGRLFVGPSLWEEPAGGYAASIPLWGPNQDVQRRLFGSSPIPD